MYYEIRDSFRLRLAVLAVTGLFVCWEGLRTGSALSGLAGAVLALCVLWLLPQPIGIPQNHFVASAVMWLDAVFSWLVLLVLFGAFMLIWGTDGARWSYVVSILALALAISVSVIFYGFIMLIEGGSCEA